MSSHWIIILAIAFPSIINFYIIIHHIIYLINFKYVFKFEYL